MAELIREHPTLVNGVRDTPYVAQLWGRELADGRWEGWIEFVPVDGGQKRRTDRETTQSTLDALRYWATSVRPVYLEGALQRSVPNGGSTDGGSTI